MSRNLNELWVNIKKPKNMLLIFLITVMWYDMYHPKLITNTTTNIRDLNISNIDDIAGKPDYFTEYQHAMFLLKSFEKFNNKPYHDHKQKTFGWGTRATKKEISIDEANTITLLHYQKIYDNILKKYTKLTTWQAHVVANFAYNTPIGKSLDKALKDGRIDDAARIMKRYVYVTRNARGKPIKKKKLDGLVRRRKYESMFLVSEPTDNKIQEITKENMKIVAKEYVK